MSPLFRTTAGLALALLIGSRSEVLAESSGAERCGWVRPALATRPKPPKFSLNVVLRAFSFTKAAANPVSTEIQASANPELHKNRIEAEVTSQPSEFRLLPARNALPNLFSWMRGWRLEKDRGLFRPIRSRSRIALGYSDIFETGGDPDKGGHGLGLLFRHDFGANPHLN